MCWLRKHPWLGLKSYHLASVDRVHVNRGVCLSEDWVYPLVDCRVKSNYYLSTQILVVMIRGIDVVIDCEEVHPRDVSVAQKQTQEKWPLHWAFTLTGLDIMRYRVSEPVVWGGFVWYERCYR